MTRRTATHRLHTACAVIVVSLASASVVRTTAAQTTVPSMLDLSKPLTYFIAPGGNSSSGFRAGDDQLARWALTAWLRSVDASATLKPAAERDAIIRLYWAGPQEGQYGETQYFVLDGKRGARVFVRPDLTALGPDIAEHGRTDSLFRDTIVYLTCVHELGHAFGLEHTRDFRDIMYAFGYGGDIVEYFMRYRRLLTTRDDIAAHTGLSNADATRVKALYGR